jgi:hypothetical protein
MRQYMKSTLAIATGIALTALALGIPASALAAPAGVGSAQDTVETLESSGYKVVLDKVGSGPLGQCTVDAVRPGETVTGVVQDGANTMNQTIYQTVYLTAKC